MRFLVPDDPVFLGMFIGIEQPLLHNLYYFYRNDLSEGQELLIRTAYDKWGEIQQCFPSQLQWQALVPAARGQESREDYALHDSRGRKLTSLYSVDVPAGHLHTLRACHTMLARAEQGTGRLTEVLGELAEETQVPCLVDTFGRVLDVMEFRAPPGLLEAVGREARTGRAPALTLDAAQEAAYQDFCGRVVYALSAGDGFTYASHRALYS
ncbi:hypothetical protein [Streptomyces prasinopilosus]|uniref:hypothetical protein n=1 Tax=Streptomyces prasinopilosus TaxID=67344 RepID=UPI000A451655|nr:hypothetical protein [Streptomyces prasinopilosus]